MSMRTPTAVLVEPSFEAKEVLERQNRWAGYGNKTDSLRTLPSKYKVTDATCHPPIFQYGISLTYQQLLDYALHHHPVEVPENPENDDPEVIYLLSTCFYKGLR
ncbi:uncharacterized protein ARMOST_03005 [Armillaria ostoyae]|uniref:Uncharacterized protein n=1 Tax=Armillaria ostoyae TaxID=47428 RepID=A0A284QT80_ARMOS|nr:uncharacterized protein ARMOST_03005 [Armillaria ostoyae]